MARRGLAFLAIAALSPIAAASGASAAGVPRATVEGSGGDLGQIYDGDAPTITFVIGNAGDAPLTLGKVQPSCGCTTFELENRVVGPGQKVKLVARFDSRGWSGKYTKSIAVETNDPANPTLKLEFIVEVLERYSIKPTVLFLPEIDREKGETAELEFADNTDEGIEIVEATVDDPRLAVEVVRLSPPGKPARARIVLRIPPGLTEGRLETHINIKTNDPKKPQESVFVVGRVKTR